MIEAQTKTSDEPVLPTADDPRTVTHNLLLFPEFVLGGVDLTALLILLLASDSFIFLLFNWIPTGLSRDSV
jgi:hypothetical protein